MKYFYSYHNFFCDNKIFMKINFFRYMYKLALGSRNNENSVLTFFFSTPVLMRPENADALFKTVMNFYFSHITILLFHFNHKSSFYTCDIRLYIINLQKQKISCTPLYDSPNNTYVQYGFYFHLISFHYIFINFLLFFYNIIFQISSVNFCVSKNSSY